MTVNNVNEYFFVNNSITVQNNVSEVEDANIFDISDAKAEEKNDNKIPLIAHRGYSSVAPENTLPAFYLAAEMGFTTAECDIEWTKDNVPVLLHDSIINRTARTADGRRLMIPKYCENCTYDELLKLDFGIWKDKLYKGIKIPSFQELLQCSQETGLQLYVEIKPTSDFNEEKALILVNAVKEAHLEDKVTWISFNADYLRTIGNLMPESRLGYLYDGKVTTSTIKTLDSLKTSENEVFLDVKSSRMNYYADFLLDNAGYEFEAWTIDNIKDIDAIYDFECSGITTNSITEEEIGKYLDTKN